MTENRQLDDAVRRLGRQLTKASTDTATSIANVVAEGARIDVSTQIETHAETPDLHLVPSQIDKINRLANPSSAAAGLYLRADGAGASFFNEIDQLRGRTINTAAPAVGDAYVWNGTSWTATSVAQLAGDSVGYDRRVVTPAAVTYPPQEHFRTPALSSGWAWAGAPFTTPSINVSQLGDFLRVSPTAPGGARHFLFRTGTGFLNKFIECMCMCGQGSRCGIRVDDGSDNNWCALCWDTTAGFNVCVATIRQRSGGGAITSVATPAPTIPFASLGRLILGIIGVGGTSWQPYFYASQPAGLLSVFLSGTTVTWTPQRFGIVVHDGTAGFPDAAIDWIGWNI